MKKLLLGMAMLFAVALLVACGGDDPAPTATTDAEATPTVAVEPGGNEELPGNEFGGENFVLWIDNPEYGNALVARLEELFPDSNFSFEEVGGTDTLDRLRLDGPAEIGADIVLFPHDQIPGAINERLLLPLGPDIANAMHGRIPEAAIGAVVHNDNYFGIPLRMESIALFYNLDLLNEAGLDVPTTWEEIIEAAADYNNVATNDFLIRWEVGGAFFNQFFLTTFGYELFGPNHNDPDAINFDTPEAIEGLEYFASLRDILPVPYGDLGWDETNGAFVAGEVPLLIIGPWAIPYIQRDGAGFEWGVTTIPTINGVQPRTFSGNHIAAASSFTNYPDLARAVLEFMMSDEGLQMVYDEIGVIPALIDGSVINGLSEDAALSGIAAQAVHSHPMPAISEMDFFWDAADAMYRAVWNGLLTPAEAAANAVEDFEAARALATQ